MSKQEEGKNSKSFSQIFADFLHQNRFILLIGLIGVALVILGISVFSVIGERKVEKGTIASEKLMEHYSQWQNSEDEQIKNNLETEIDAMILEIEKSYSGTFPHQRAQLIRANMFYDTGNWEEAVSHFSNIVDEYPRSYLAPIALYSLGAAYEELGRIDMAIEAFQRLFESYKDLSPDAPRALFSVGRLYESDNEHDSALDVYYEVLEAFPDSDWTKLAQARIIFLEAN